MIFSAQLYAAATLSQSVCSLYLFAERKEFSPYTTEGQLRCHFAFSDYCMYAH